MFQMRRILLLLALLSWTPTAPAFARLVIGVTPAVTPGAGDPGVVRALEDELSSRLGEAVQVRSFDSEATQLDWLIRFRELDAALVGHGLLHTLPAGTLVHLADLPSATAVTQPGVSAARQEQLKRTFRSLLEEERGRLVLNRLTGTAKAAEMPKPGSMRRTPLPVASVPVKLATDMPRENTPVTSKQAATPPSKPAESAPSQSSSLPAVPSTAAAPPAAPTAALSAPPSAAPQPAQAPARQAAAAPAPAKERPAASTTAATPSVEPSNPKRTRLILLAALVIMIGISVKILLLMRHWEQKKKALRAYPETMDAEAFGFLTGSEQPAPEPPPPVPATAASMAAADDNVRHIESGAASGEQASPLTVVRRTAISEAAVREKRSAPNRTSRRKAAHEQFPPAGDIDVVEQGSLGKTKVPALLKRCADLPRPVTLRVRSGDNETCIHFAAGQICHAYSRNWQIGEEPRQWSKLGYLMVRDGLISEAQRDQALELLERQPGLRFVAALQKLGILDLEALRHILARQAKTTVFALILFYSGEFRVEVDTGALPAEESIALQVDALLREASHHQAEWMAIRKALPTLGTMLDFAPDGREKLEQVRLSVHQQLLLSQVDGQTSIGTLCSRSTMMDYEACRFLYLMVKAGVLQVVAAA